MILNLLLTDLVADLSPAVRLQRLVDSLREHFRCGAVVLLQREEERLHPVAMTGLAHEALGRRFAVAQHPRLAAILARRDITFFHADSELPDPYDGLIDDHASLPLPVHDCMGTSLYVEGMLWGALTLDALQVGLFDSEARSDLRQFTPAIEAAIRITRLETENRSLRMARGPTVLPHGAMPEENEIIGQSESIASLLRELSVVADSELPVLLLGETGVGKELFAHCLHRKSRRSNKPLVHVNCAALPESLAESELFGHVKGAFSGAVSERPGRFEAAEGGTLFLDEVGELSLAMQAKLLRTLQNGEIQRLGADRPLRVDVRVIAATNRNLRELVRDGSFRVDLYHRLSVYPVHIPPLRERGNDVLLLAGRFLEENRARLGLRSLRLSANAEDALRAYRWPGNVRELEHMISRAALKAISHSNERNDIVILQPEHLDPSMQFASPAMPGEVAPGTHLTMPLRETVESCQRQAIRAALTQHAGNWASAARQLDIDPSNLRKLARRLAISREYAGKT